MGTAYTLCAITETPEPGSRARQDWSEADLLVQGYAGNLSVFTALQQRCGFTLGQVAELCGVDERTVRRWHVRGCADRVKALEAQSGPVQVADVRDCPNWTFAKNSRLRFRV